MIFRLTVLALCVSLIQAYSDDRYMHEAAYKASHKKAVGEPEAPEFWFTSAQEDLTNKIKSDRKVGEAKNVIMFLGDGWGVPSITASRILKGQAVDTNVTFGEEGQLHLDTFPYSGMSKTFCVDAQTADSACSATAYLGGVKGNTGTIGVNSNVARNNCSAQIISANHVSSIVAWAQAAGKSTGVITTSRITDASPSGAYAHIANRDWESDVRLPDNAKQCPDISSQLILMNPGQNINVIMGGGRNRFFPATENDSEGQPGERQDGKNLVEMWKTSKTGNGTTVNATYVEKVEELLRVDASKTDYLLGLFAPTEMAYYHDQAKDLDPTLTDMTEKAIQILSKNPKGFFLFVEGGRIDHGHHANEAFRAIWEAVEFDRAIKKGDDMTNDNDTLLVVTADHSHSFSFAGYNERGSNITNIAGEGSDNLPYTALSYANGPGYVDFTNGVRHNISNDDIHSLTYKQVPLVPMNSDTHGGEDVMIFAKGPFAHLFTGVHQQSYIAHAMGYASCVGSGLTYCKEREQEQDNAAHTVTGTSITVLVTLMSIISMLYQ